MDYDCDYFISYAHDDNKSEDDNSGFVDEFVRKLKNSPEHKQMFGREIEVFFDKTGINPMSDWDNRIRSKLSTSRFFVVLLSPNYFKSEYCAKEFDWWMQHEMHRRVLGEGTAPMLIVAVDDLYNYNVNPLPEIPQDIQVKFPNWVKQIRQIQSGPDFDMHDLERAKIDEILRSLCENTKDKYFKQVIAEESPINAGYPQYNKYFVGRRENLRSLRQALSTSCTTAISAVNGLGGIGKTELALTYGHAFAWDYELGRVFATCENIDSLEDVILSSSIAEMHGLELKGTNEQKLTTLYNALKRKIKLIEQRNEEKNIDRTLGTHVLIILDNVNRLDLISQRNLYKLPKFFHVIITTRESANDFPYIHTERVDRLSEDESVELLSNLRPFGSDEKEVLAAREIAKLLDGFTLAVELTGAYLSRSPRITYQKQYDRLKANISGTMETMADKTQKLQGHQAECISVVLQSTLSALSDNARKALDFAALMSPDAVGFSWLPELLGLDEDERLEVLDELTGYCLLTPLGGESNIARIHRLVAEAVKQEIPEDVQKEIIAKIRGKCNELLHKDKTFWCTPENSWNITPVSEFCLALAEQWTVEVSLEEIDCNLSWMLDHSGGLFLSLGKMNEARKVFQRFYEMSVERVKAFPKSVGAHQDLCTSYNKLGDLENATGNAIPAREWYEKALIIRQWLADRMQENVQIQRDLCISYIKLGDWEKAVGNLTATRQWFEKAMIIRQKLTEMMPEDVELLKDLCVSYERLGDLEYSVGNTKATRDWYEKDLETREKLAKMKPEDVNVQQYLCIPYLQLGKLEEAAGNAVAAKEWYEKALHIQKILVEKMPENVDAQRNMSVSYEYLGILEKSAGNIVTAREWFENTLEIRKRLADMIPDSVDAQLNLSSSYSNFGNLEIATGNVTTARKWFEKALEVFMKLADKMPDNVDTQRDLYVIYKNIGDLENSAGDVAAARVWYEKDLEISKRLADQMPDNVDAQRNLSITYSNLGDLEKNAGNVAAARKWYKKNLEIFMELADKMPESVVAQRDLSYLYKRLGDVEKASGETSAARDWYEKALEISQRLADKMPDNVDAQRGLGVSCSRLGDVERASGNASIARYWYEKALSVFQLLADKMPDNVQAQKDLAETQEKLAQLP